MDSGETIPTFKSRIDRNADNCFWTSKISDEIQWFHFQDSLMHVLENLTNTPNDVLLTSLLKVFVLFMVKFNYKQNSTDQNLVGIYIKCINGKHEVYCKIDNIKDNYHIIVFIKAIVLQHVGISWLIQTKDTK